MAGRRLLMVSWAKEPAGRRMYGPEEPHLATSPQSRYEEAGAGAMVNPTMDGILAWCQAWVAAIVWAPLAQDPPPPLAQALLAQEPPAQAPPPAPAQDQPPAQAPPGPVQRPQAPPWGRWLDQDTNPCLNFQRIGESMQRPLELCSWTDLEALPPVGKEYQQRYKLVNDRLLKVRQRLHRAAEYRRGIDGRAHNNA
ncbi:hypothetical protein QJQ45_004398 [Haematococcus lacustris]|nr:hypothetical protein QJQ45_004398 [Haematococcus lacustris]